MEPLSANPPVPASAPRARSAVGLWVLVLLAFAPCLQAGFLWCDDYTVERNAALQDLAGILRLWRGGVTEQYYPLTYTLYAVVVHTVGPEPWALHAVSLALHALCASLLWRLGARFLRPRVAYLAAALFAVHPLMVESVGWIYELKNPWSTMWMLLSLAAWFRFEDHGRPAALWGSLGLFLLALLAKTAVLVMPVGLLVATWIRGGASRPRCLRALVPFLLLAVGFAALTWGYEAHFTGASGAEWQAGLASRLCVAGEVFWFYLARMAMPWELAFAYGRFTPDPGRLLSWLPLVLAVAAGVVLWRRRRQGLGRAGLVWMGLYGLTVLPVSGLVNIYMHRYSHVADHLAYLPWLVTAPFAAALLDQVGGRWPARRLLVGVVVGLLALLTFQRSITFQSQEALWREALARDEGLWLPHVQLGLLARGAGDLEEAERRFERALELQDSADANVNLGNVLAEQGRLGEALPRLSRARELGALDPGSRHSLASALASAGQLDEAIAEYRTLVGEPVSGDLAQHNLDRLLTLRAQLDAEAERLSEILVERPEDAAAWRRLSETRLARGDAPGCLEALRRWLALEPEAADGWQTLTWLLTSAPRSERRDGEQALAAASRLQALRGDDDPRALEVIAAAHAVAGRFEHAQRLIERALRLIEDVPSVQTLRPRLEAAARRYAEGLPPP